MKRKRKKDDTVRRRRKRKKKSKKKEEEEKPIKGDKKGKRREKKKKKKKKTGDEDMKRMMKEKKMEERSQKKWIKTYEQWRREKTSLQKKAMKERNFVFPEGYRLCKEEYETSTTRLKKSLSNLLRIGNARKKRRKKERKKKKDEEEEEEEEEDPSYLTTIRETRSTIDALKTSFLDMEEEIKATHLEFMNETQKLAKQKGRVLDIIEYYYETYRHSQSFSLGLEEKKEITLLSKSIQ
ncbi:MAG: hypothetical protein ACTSUE_13880 [Promethearchaeota archaeon]